MEHQIACEKCGKNFSSKEALEQHFSAKHAQSHVEHHTTKKKRPLLKHLIIVLLAIFAIIFLSRFFGNDSSDAAANQLYPVRAITHAHGLGVDVADSSKLYIATHHGLLVLLNEKNLYTVGKSQDDYMGFSPHPTNPQVFFSSGHPSRGGNIGFQKSQDGGFNWKIVSLGIEGPVDFHAMAVSSANPEIIYGWYQGNLQRSDNGGKSWSIANSELQHIVAMTTDPKDENVVYAATVQGLMVSRNKGKDWSQLSDDLTGTQVSGIAVNPKEPEKMLSFSSRLELAKSNDAGKTWEKINEKFNDETPLYIAYDKQNPAVVYTITEKQKIYKSTDGGDTWKIAF